MKQNIPQLDDIKSALYELETRLNAMMDKRFEEQDAKIEKRSKIQDSKLDRGFKEIDEKMDKKLAMYLKISKIDTQIIVKEALKDFSEEMQSFRSDMMSRFDEILNIISTLKNENEIGAHQTHELTNTVGDHEIRITKLEQS